MSQMIFLESRDVVKHSRYLSHSVQPCPSVCVVIYGKVMPKCLCGNLWQGHAHSVCVVIYGKVMQCAMSNAVIKDREKQLRKEVCRAPTKIDILTAYTNNILVHLLDMHVFHFNGK